MAQTPKRQSEPPQEPGISLDELSRAYAQAMGDHGRPDAEPDGRLQPDDTPQQPEVEASDKPDGDRPVCESEQDDDASCQLCPRTIFEAMLFVGNRENEPLTAVRAAELMRGVEPAEIPALVDELNQRYAQNGCPYRVVSEKGGYRMALCRAFYPVRDRFYGRVREARLSQAAIDVLAIVAYRQPLSAEQISSLRGTSSGHLLGQLVRRQLLRIERPPGKRRPVRYFTTERFLKLFGLASLDELPQAEELDKR